MTTRIQWITFFALTFATFPLPAQQREAILKRFPDTDLDGDGKLSDTEFQAFDEKRQVMMAKRNPGADKNKDGKVDREEFIAFMRNRGDNKPQNPRQQKQSIKPTHADVAYGDHPQQKFDLWLAKPAVEGEPTPLCIFIHGGGFRSGDKSQAQARIIQRYLDKGISYAALNYRLTNGGEFAYPVPMMDSARGLQTIRSRAAEWNIDPEKIACHGGSAGAGISLWLGFRDDMADPDSEDPVARQSTRIIAAATGNGQSTYDMRTIRDWFGVPDLPFEDALIPFYNLQEGETADTPRVAKLAEDASSINHLTKDDIPVFMTYSRPNTTVEIDTPKGVWIHHPLLGLKLQEAMQKLDLECVVTLPGQTSDIYRSTEDFLIEKLLAE
ncbi:MAG: alpha/beta hydrolase fold domain-containing protein [Verrucomicrobiales bacterium]|nr:alpha/beta hydrolase fold domain-containing protein [Verrucomicrobiales bacterium]